MSDFISRQDAIDATWFEPSYTDPLNVLTEVRDRLKVLPSAEHHNLNVAEYIKDNFTDVWEQAEKELEVPSTERKGKWIKQEDEQCWWYECSECGHLPPKDTFKQEWLSNFCPNCGARMVGEDD